MLKSHVILNSGLPKLHNFKASTLVDYRGDFENKIGSKTGRIILVRPDAYVAFDLAALDPDAFKKQLRKWKTERSIPPETPILQEMPLQGSRSLTCS
jgi:hypothetical protein